MQKILITLFAAVILGGAGNLAHASQAAYKYVSLEQLVGSSSVILIVSKEDPNVTIERIPMDKEELRPAYERKVFHFRVVEALRNAAGSKVKGRIAVLAANELDLLKKYEESGLSISTVFIAYKPQVRYDDLSKTFVIFLKMDKKNRLRFSAEDAYESTSQRAEVVDLISKAAP